MVNKFDIFKFPVHYMKHEGSVTLAKAFFKFNYKSFLTALKVNIKSNDSLIYQTKFKKAVRSQKVQSETRNRIIDKAIFMRTRLRLFFFYILCRQVALSNLDLREDEKTLTVNDVLYH